MNEDFFINSEDFLGLLFRTEKVMETELPYPGRGRDLENRPDNAVFTS